MLWKKTGWFRKIGLAAIGFILLLNVSGCSDTSVEGTVGKETESKTQTPQQDNQEDVEEMIGICLNLYEKAEAENKIDDLEMIRSIVNRFGDNGYPAVDSRNQIDMVEAEQVMRFCEIVDAKEEAELTIIAINYLGGFVTYDLHTKDGKVDVVRSYYGYKNGSIEKIVTGSYPAEDWKYTEDGY